MTDFGAGAMHIPTRFKSVERQISAPIVAFGAFFCICASLIVFLGAIFPSLVDKNYEFLWGGQRYRLLISPLWVVVDNIPQQRVDISLHDLRTAQLVKIIDEFERIEGYRNGAALRRDELFKIPDLVSQRDGLLKELQAEVSHRSFSPCRVPTVALATPLLVCGVLAHYWMWRLKGSSTSNRTLGKSSSLPRKT